VRSDKERLAEYFPRYAVADASWDVEDAARYAPGGWLPLRAGARVGAGRFALVHKLGHDAHSTRWAARDQQPLSPHAERVVELRAFAADPAARAAADAERAAAAALRPGPLRRAGAARLAEDDPRARVQLPYDAFEEPGADDGDAHACHVYPLLGPRVPDLARYSPAAGIEGRLAPAAARAIIADVAAAVAVLHAHGVAHGGQFSVSSLHPTHRSRTY
jgi:hypothetical protein